MLLSGTRVPTTSSPHFACPPDCISMMQGCKPTSPRCGAQFYFGSSTGNYRRSDVIASRVFRPGVLPVRIRTHVYACMVGYAFVLGFKRDESDSCAHEFTKYFVTQKNKNNQRRNRSCQSNTTFSPSSPSPFLCYVWYSHHYQFISIVTLISFSQSCHHYCDNLPAIVPFNC